jgi:3-oxoadipate enol-lactonase
MPHVEVAGRMLHHIEPGEGRPLLCIQGMSGTHVSWGEPFLAALRERGIAPLAYDHRSTGRSARSDDPFTLGDLAEDAAALLEALGHETIDVLGISMGGMVAQELALRHPERVRRLVLGCTYAGGPGQALAGPDVQQLLGEALMSGDRERALRAGFEVNLSKAYATEANWPAFEKMATTLPVAVEVIGRQAQAIMGHDTSARLGELAMPVLVVHGDEDRMLPVQNGRAIAEAIPGARLEVLEGVGHMFWWEQPERSAALIADFVLAQ